MKYCGQCGQANDQQSPFCGRCGAPFMQQQVPAGGLLPMGQPYVQRLPKKRGAMFWVLTISGGVFVTFCLCLGILATIGNAIGPVKPTTSSINRTNTPGQIALISTNTPEPTNTPVSTGTPDTKATKSAQSTITALSWTPTRTPTPRQAPTQTPVPQLHIVVTSVIVKHIPGDKYRYFFDVRNDDHVPFNGSVVISVYTQAGGDLNDQQFDTTSPIQPGLGDSVYFDMNTGPVAIMGQYGIARFTYTITHDGNQVGKGSGTISTQYEDLSQ